MTICLRRDEFCVPNLGVEGILRVFFLTKMKWNVTLCSQLARCADNSVIGMIGSLKQFPGFLAEHNTMVRPPDFHTHWSPLVLDYLKLNLLYYQVHSRDSLTRPGSADQPYNTQGLIMFSVRPASSGISRHWVSEAGFLSSCSQKDSSFFLWPWTPLQDTHLFSLSFGYDVRWAP